MSFDYKKFKETMKTKGIKGRSAGIMLETGIEKVLKKIKADFKLESREEAMALITGLCQNGGTNRNAGLNVTYSYDNKILDARTFQKICQIEGSGTARQFARAMNNPIYHFAVLLEEEGDLARQMRLDHPDITQDQAIWCSNYQSDNPLCPELVRNWLKNDLRRRFKH